MWEVLIRRELRPLIDDLKGRKTGYADAYAQLQRDPCAIYPPGAAGEDGRPFAYRISGPLEPKVCGTRLKRDYRLAFSMQPSDGDDVDGIVIVLYAGPRNHRQRKRDVWTIVHDLFETENPPEDHLRPPCCETGTPHIDQDDLDQFMTRLNHLVRGR